ncbi:MAG TPA: hypothetical protein VK528_02025, partial [Flavobacterium sp.]|nr:hypothetical protein [Flavobacterium sp.]
GCSPDSTDEGNGITDSNLDAGFSVTPSDASGNRYTLQANPGGGFLGDSWDLGTGAGLFPGESVQEAFFPDAGTYQVTHQTAGRGGLPVTAVQTITVPTSDPEAGNRVINGIFANGSTTGWTVLDISPSGASVTFSADGATFIGTGYNQKAIYQAIEIEAGESYKIDMKVSGPGSINTWLEVYASPQAPTPGADYTADGKRMGLSTWDGCATSLFSGQLSVVGCVGSGNEVTFPTSGTIYLLIKSGGDNIGGGPITVTNIEFRKVS